MNDLLRFIIRRGTLQALMIRNDGYPSDGVTIGELSEALVTTTN